MKFTKFWIYIIISIIQIFGWGCRLTEKSVSGKWISIDDTLIINSNHSLIYKQVLRIYPAGSESNDTIIDKKGNRIIKVRYNSQAFDSIKFFSGTWSISKRFIKLNFDDGQAKIFFGDCSGLGKRRRSFSRYKLIRPMYCRKPTHHFVVFSKLR